MLDAGIGTTLKVDDNLIIQFVPTIFFKVNNSNNSSLDNQRKMVSSQELGVTEELKKTASLHLWSGSSTEKKKENIPIPVFIDSTSTLLDIFVKAIFIHFSVSFLHII